MAKIFYLGGGAHSRGMLRAVVTIDQLESLLSPDLVTHVGDDFPEACDAPITLVEVSREEGVAAWPAGYSRVNASPTDFDERLRFLPEPITSHERPKDQVRRSGSGLFHWLTRGYAESLNMLTVLRTVLKVVLAFALISGFALLAVSA
jgi:hypothetical protein